MVTFAQKRDRSEVLPGAARSGVGHPSTPPLRGSRFAVVGRDGIAWRATGSNVEVLVELVNHQNFATEPATLIIEAAPLGAFVPWQSLARIPVGPIVPGARLHVTRSVAAAALPPFDLRRVAMDGGFGPNFPPDGVDLITATEWAGNLNVSFESAPEHAVEVHRAFDLKVAAGRHAAVGVYAPTCDEFHVDLECMGAGWTAELVHAPRQPTALVVVGTPVAGRRAVVNLWVTRLLDERQVLVELAFRSIDGPSDPLGCLRV